MELLRKKEINLTLLDFTQAVEIFKHLPDNAELYLHELVFQESATVICRRCKERKINCSSALKVLPRICVKIKKFNLTGVESN